MKKTYLIFPLIVLCFLSACINRSQSSAEIDESQSSTLVAEIVNQSLTASAPAETNASSTASPGILTTNYENAASVELQLILGILKLEGSPESVTPEQAASLLPLFQSYSNLRQNMMPSIQALETSQPQTINIEAQTQTTEILQQIQSILTTEQIQAISNMQITLESSQILMQELGLDMTTPQNMPNTASSDTGPGQPPQGTPPVAQQMSAGEPPSGSQPPMEGSFIHPQLLEILLEFLQQKIIP